jgi:hypothetical protein
MVKKQFGRPRHAFTPDLFPSTARKVKSPL